MPAGRRFSAGTANFIIGDAVIRGLFLMVFPVPQVVPPLFRAVKEKVEIAGLALVHPDLGRGVMADQSRRTEIGSELVGADADQKLRPAIEKRHHPLIERLLWW